MAATTFSFSSPVGVARIKIETTQYFNFDIEMDSKPSWWSDVVETSISPSLNAANSACGQHPMIIISCHWLLHPLNINLASAPATSFSRAFFCLVYGSSQTHNKLLLSDSFTNGLADKSFGCILQFTLKPYGKYGPQTRKVVIYYYTQTHTKFC